jgi:hypothetical protein
MSENVAEDLVEYQAIMISLVRYAAHPKLDLLIDKLTPQVRRLVKFRIKMEIKRLAARCYRALDCRPYFDECELVAHDNLNHYLDEISKTLFMASIEENNGVFDNNIYNLISSKAKSRHLREKKLEKITQQQSKIDNGGVSAIKLVNDNICRDQVVSMQSQSRLFSFDPLGMSRKGKENNGTLVDIIDINQQYLIIKSDSAVIEAQQEIVYLWLYEHHQAINFEEEIVLEYTLEQAKQNKSSNNFHYRLKLNKSFHSEMYRRLNNLLDQQLAVVNKQRSNQIRPLIDSINAKVHEQFLLPSTTDIAMLCAEYQSGWRPSAALKTDSNQALFDFFSENNSISPIDRLFSNSTIQQALSRQMPLDLYAYVLRHQYQDKCQFVVIWQHQLSEDQGATNFLSEHVLGGNYRLIRLKLLPINAEPDAHVPSAVPSHVSPVMEMLNRPLTTATSTLVNSNKYLATLSDVTEINHILGLNDVLKVPSDQPPIDHALQCPTQYSLPQLTRKSPMEVVEVARQDGRGEDRFAVALPVCITRCDNYACDLGGLTTNISPRGLAVSLTSAFHYKAGAQVLLQIKLPYQGKQVVLHKQLYQVIGGKDKFSLRLVIVGSQHKHKASQLLRELIYQKMDHLKTTGTGENETFGLQRALRNIYANNHACVPFFMHRDKRQWYINSAVLNDNNQLDSLGSDQTAANQMLIKFIEQEKFLNYCLGVINKISQTNPREVFYIFTLPRDKNGEGKQMFWFQDLQQLQLTGNLEQYIERIRDLGKPSILRIQLSKPGEVFNKYFRDELSYLAKLCPDSAQTITDTIDQISAIGEITDHTRQILDVYDRWIADNSLPLANVG